MKHALTLATLALTCRAAPALADPFQRPIPQPQTDTAELWYLLASLALLASLYAVHRLVNRR